MRFPVQCPGRSCPWLSMRLICLQKRVPGAWQKGQVFLHCVLVMKIQQRLICVQRLQSRFLLIRIGIVFGALVFVTQTPDYVLPATSHILQDRLGLKNDVLCLDINEGCSGYVTGVYVASLLAKQLKSRVCLLGGDTITKLTLPVDRATRCIFGDAGTATIIEPGEQNVAFSFASYGERYNAIIMENSRHRMKENPVNEGWLYLDGVGIMNFTLNEVPGIMQEIVVKKNISMQEVSLFACHQANRMILQSLAEKLQVPVEKIPFTAGECGNESSASIPMVLTASDKACLANVMCCGFGVGLSAGAFLYDFTETAFYGVCEI